MECAGGLSQEIPEITKDLKELYKTVWEVSQKTIIKMAADRGAFIDQSQSLNIHIAEPNYGKLTSMHFYGWKQVKSRASDITTPQGKRGSASHDVGCVFIRVVCVSPQGLKTGMYYLRTKPAANPIQFTLNKEKLKEGQPAKNAEETKERNMAAMVCSLENRDDCVMCGS